MGNKITQIADSIHGSLQISDFEKRIISTHAFNRLHNILQNSTVYLTYPSNQTKRFAHSLGVMHLGGNMFVQSIINAEENIRKDFFKSVKFEIDHIMKDGSFSASLRHYLGEKVSIADNLAYLSMDEIIYQSQTPNIIDEEITFYYQVLFQAVRCAALLHDIGHPPFSHITEHSLNEVLEWINEIPEEERTIRQNTFVEITQPYLNRYSKKIALHEEIGNRISNRLLELVVREFYREKGHKEESAKWQLFYLIVHQVTMEILTERTDLFKAIHGLIDGSIDCDRLDYVTRDIENSGFNQGRVEYERLISSMNLIRTSGNFYFAPNIRSLSTIEDFFNRRWFLYKYVIFHHRVAKTDHLLGEVIVKLAKDYLSKSDTETQGKEKEKQYTIPLDISGLWRAIKESYSDENYFNGLIQWDDAWLLTVLRNEYFSKYVDSKETVKLKLEELLSNKRNYNSIIKRMNDFSKVDRVVALSLQFDWDDIDPEIKNDFPGLVEPLVQQRKEYSGRLWDINQPQHVFYLSSIHTLMSVLSAEDYLKEAIINSISRACTSLGHQDCITVFKSPSTGLGDNAYIEAEGQALKLGDVSRIHVDLLNNQLQFPVFFAYFSNERELDIVKAQETIGKEIAQELDQLLPKILC